MLLFNQPANTRDVDKMKAAIPFMKQIKFFSQREIDDEEYLLLMNSMEHLYCPKGRIVYEEGEFGDKFYIILIGTVSIYISDSSTQDKSLVRGLKRMKKLSAN